MPAFALYQVDAFTNKIFSGNPAAVCPLDSWPPDRLLQNIAAENNLSETAFFVPLNNDRYHIRWFTPVAEVKLCGHATLAAAYVLFNHLGHKDKSVAFKSLSGLLLVEKTPPAGYRLDLPAGAAMRAAVSDPRIEKAFGAPCEELYKGNEWAAFFKEPEFIRRARPDLSIINSIEAEGLVITAPGDDGYDFVSRYFCPQFGINEDPATGATHCLLTPIWAEKLGKTVLKARQVSARGGDLICEIRGDRILITGEAVLYMQGTIHL